MEKVLGFVLINFHSTKSQNDLIFGLSTSKLVGNVSGIQMHPSGTYRISSNSVATEKTRFTMENTNSI